eukprot:TRINITY_DN1056_c0_g2_i1.p1 TRINITY_DN1056_c0_g2~~TRINITY_DN1056_c0_g2_i1.p1  ORF type:complete len:332 (-),score=33.88 TRINITY_DN1056_c0_g2_i1:76-1071(-)
MGLKEQIASSMAEGLRHPDVIFVIILNISSSIFIVFANKLLFLIPGFSFVITLTCVHFLVTSIGMFVCSQIGMFQPKKLQLMKVFDLSVLNCGFVVITNLSLRYNSVGFYQVVKVMTTPTILIIEYFWWNTVLPLKILLTLIPICFGVALTSLTDFQLNFVGSVWAILGVIVTSIYQIRTGKLQKELECNSMQLLYYQAPVSALCLAFIAPFFEDLSFSSSASVWRFFMEYQSLGYILGSGAISFFVNLSIFLLIGKTSPVTYNVVGHFKFSCVLLGGYLLFEQPVAFWNLVGVFVTITGIILYTHFKLQQSSQAGVSVMKKSEDFESQKK